MSIEKAFRWNKELLNENTAKKGTITLIVTNEMIQNVIKKSGTRNWKIVKVGKYYLSNKERFHCAKMTYTNELYFLHRILENLEISRIEADGEYEYYRTALERNTEHTFYSYNKKPQIFAFNFATKTHRLIENLPIKHTEITSKNFFKRIYN